MGIPLARLVSIGIVIRKPPRASHIIKKNATISEGPLGKSIENALISYGILWNNDNLGQMIKMMVMVGVIVTLNLIG